MKPNHSRQGPAGILWVVEVPLNVAAKVDGHVRDAIERIKQGVCCTGAAGRDESVAADNARPAGLGEPGPLAYKCSASF